MRWNRKGMVVCLILFFVVMGALTIQSIKQNQPAGETEYASEEDVISLPEEQKGKKENPTAETVTGAGAELHAVRTQKNITGEKKNQEKQTPQAAAAPASGQKAQKETPQSKKKSGKKSEKSTTGKKIKNNTDKKGTSPERTTVPTATPISGKATQKPEQPKAHLEIQCKAILDKRELWREGIEEIIPESGVFYSGDCPVHEGETVYNLLKRVCQERDIALDCSYTPLYGSYYVRGIGNLYELDCGDESGWKYMVNGVMPGVSASQYEVQDQDKIAFVYQYKI